MTPKRDPSSSRRRAGDQAPEGYDPRAFPPFAVTVDVVVLTLVDQRLATLLVRRGGPPFEGSWALPGGFVRPEESLNDAAARELREETGVEAADFLEQLGAYGDPERDPRLRVVTVAYLAVLRDVGRVQAGTDADEAALVPVAKVLRSKKYDLAFDHRQILEDAIEQVREKLQSTPLATAFVGPEFTLSELRSVYETAWETEIDPGNFRRKLLAEPEFLESTGRRRASGPEGGKPAEVYRKGRARTFSTPIRPPGRGK